MVQEVLFSISIVIAIAAILTVLGRIIKQPPIISYLFAGILISPLFFNLLSSNSSDMIQTLAHIGVAFLLFIVGLSLDLKVLKEIGFVSTFSGIAEIILSGGIGIIIAVGLGFSNISALYIGAALAFSSTVVVVKILSDKKEIDTLHGRIALGILIVEDFVAAIALMIIPLISESRGVSSIIYEFLTGIGLILLVFLISALLFNRIMNYLARSQEALFLFGIAWALILASAFDALGFSLEIGALIAGMSLASSKYSLDLGGKIKPLRDFFVILFFVFFGSQLTGKIDFYLILRASLLSLFIIIGKPLIVMTVLRLCGYKKRTNFLAGITIAQISEFSLIIVLLGFTLGHLNQEIMSLVIIVALMTIGLSSYTIYYSHWIFNKISRLLGIFEGKKFESKTIKERDYEILLLGYHRIGYKIMKSLLRLGKKFAVVDYNPKVILSLGKDKIDCIYGDASDKEFLKELRLEKVKVIISTIPDFNVNFAITEYLKEIKSNAVFLATTEHSKEALELYEKEVDFVIVPQHLGGNYVSSMIEKYGLNKEKYREEGRKHLKEIEEGKKNSIYK